MRELTVDGLPSGYRYGVTRYADVILEQAFPRQFADIASVLDGFQVAVSELKAAGGGRTKFVKRFDGALEERGWGKKNITIEKLIDGVQISRERGHEIDMFSAGSADATYPGITCEMQWNNKDPFFDRDLLSFGALHREGAVGVGIIVTRGPTLQDLIEHTILHPGKPTSKYGKASTHWDKLVPRVNLGGGGECPLLLVGIEPDRIDGVDVLRRAMSLFDQAAAFKAGWHRKHSTWEEAKPEYEALRTAARQACWDA